MTCSSRLFVVQQPHHFPREELAFPPCSDVARPPSPDSPPSLYAAIGVKTSGTARPDRGNRSGLLGDPGTSHPARPYQQQAALGREPRRWCSNSRRVSSSAQCSVFQVLALSSSRRAAAIRARATASRRRNAQRGRRLGRRRQDLGWIYQVRGDVVMNPPRADKVRPRPQSGARRPRWHVRPPLVRHVPALGTAPRPAPSTFRYRPLRSPGRWPRGPRGPPRAAARSRPARGAGRPARYPRQQCPLLALSSVRAQPELALG